MGTFELVNGDNDLSVTITPVRGVFVVALANQTPVVLSDVQFVWFPPFEGIVLTKMPILSIPPMGEVTVLAGYSCPSVGTWRLMVIFRSGDGTEESLVCSLSIVTGNSAPGSWRSTELWRDLTPSLSRVEVTLPPAISPSAALLAIGREITSGLIALKNDDLTLASIDPVVMVRLIPPGKIAISHAFGAIIPDPAFLVGKLIGAGSINHHRSYFQLGTAVSQLRLFLDINWYVDETVNTINKIHRILMELKAPPVLDSLIPMLDKRETLKDLTAVERQLFEKTLEKLEQLICPA